MAAKFPIHPAHPERICWGCDKFCATTEMACANERAAHPSELFGDDWLEWDQRQYANASDRSTFSPPDGFAGGVPNQKT